MAVITARLVVVILGDVGGGGGVAIVGIVRLTITNNNLPKPRHIKSGLVLNDRPSIRSPTP